MFPIKFAKRILLWGFALLKLSVYWVGQPAITEFKYWTDLFFLVAILFNLETGQSLWQTDQDGNLTKNSRRDLWGRKCQHLKKLSGVHWSKDALIFLKITGIRLNEKMQTFAERKRLYRKDSKGWKTKYTLWWRRWVTHKDLNSEWRVKSFCMKSMRSLKL